MADVPASNSGTATAAPAVPYTNKYFAEGLKALEAERFECAAQAFSQALGEFRSQYGDLGEECAEAYYRLGSALLYQYQASSTLLDARALPSVPGVAEGADAPAPDSAQDGQHASGSRSTQPSVAPVAASTSAASDGSDAVTAVRGTTAEVAGELADGSSSGDEEGEEDAITNDLQLAWENLETAKLIWTRQGHTASRRLGASGPPSVTLPLDVHALLGDVALENEDFQSAASDYGAALKLFSELEAGVSLRRVAELHFKNSMALQFLDRMPEALHAVRAARVALQTRAAQLAAQEDAGAAAASEQVEIAELLGDLEAKEEELAESASANVTTQSLVQSALARLKDGDREGVGGETDEESAARGHGTSTAAVIASQGGLDEPSASLSAAPIQDLGTVGRGTKRLVLQPAQANGTAATAAFPASGPKKARRLEDLMGDDAHPSGFDASAAVVRTLPQSENVHRVHGKGADS